MHNDGRYCIKIIILNYRQHDFIVSLCTGSYNASSEMLCGKHSCPALYPCPNLNCYSLSPNLSYAALIPLHPSLQLLSCLPKSWHHDPDQGLLHLLQWGGISWGVEGRWVGLASDGGSPLSALLEGPIFALACNLLSLKVLWGEKNTAPSNNICHTISACPQFNKPRACTAFWEGLETPASKLMSALTWVCLP